MEKLTIILLFLCPTILCGQSGSVIVGSVGGTINASMYGGAIYSIPLEIPKGICNMQPELGIVYNSQGGNGLLGYGWNLNGISSITRTGSTLFHDGKMTAADLGDDDRFMLDGMRLIKVATSGNDEEYRTEQDEFSKIIFHKEGGYYSKCEVWLENGNIIKYGYSSNSRLMAADGNNVIKWMVSSITDRNGNTISYSYETVNAGSDIYISHIFYTSNSQAGIRPYFKISFTYSDNRFDSYHYYIAGNKITSNKLLTQIDVLKSAQTLETYSFTYDGNSNRMYNLLTQISLSKGQYALNPTVITWNTDSNDIQNNTMSTQEINSSILDEFAFVGDVNGDGYTDLLTVPYKPNNGYTGNVTVQVFLNNMDGSFNLTPNATVNAPDSLEWIHVFDINGDGFDDIVMQTLTSVTNGSSTTYTSGFIVYESQNGTSFNNAFSTSMNGKMLAKVGDFLGEGRNGLLLLKLMVWDEDSNTHILDGYPGILRYTSSYSLNSFDTYLLDFAYILTDDFNGDGKTELVFFNTNYREIFSFNLQNGNYTMSSNLDSFSCSDYVSFFSGDFNNDGKADILYCDAQNSNNKYISFSTGNGFTAPIRVTNSALTNIAFPEMHLYNCTLENVTSQGLEYGINLADIDGDGKSDILYYNGNKKPTFFRNISVSNSANPTAEFKTVFQASNSDIVFKNQYFTMGNFLGEDHPSFIAVDPQNAYTTSDDIVSIYTFPSTAQVFSVHSITDGYGNQTELDFCYLMPGNSGFYHFNNRPFANDMKPFAMPLLAMRSHIEHIGGNSYKTSFEYTNFIMHRTGRGFIGFDNLKRTSYVNNTPIKIETGWTQTATMGINAMALPAYDSVFLCSNGDTILSETREYTFDAVRCSRQLTNGKRLVTRPAMTAQKTKHFNPDHPGSLLSVELENYTYNYTSRKSYSYTYVCTDIYKGINATESNSPSHCDFRNSVSLSFKTDDYANWTVNRKSQEVSVTETGTNPGITRKTKYEYSATNPFLVTRCTNFPSAGLADPLTTRTDYIYDACGNVTSETKSAPFGIHDEPSVTTQYGYANHRLMNSKTTDPNGLAYQEYYYYDVYDRLTQVTGSNGLSTTYTYYNTFGTDVLTTMPGNIRSREVLAWASGNSLAPSDALYYKDIKTAGKPNTRIYYDAAGNAVRTVTENHRQDPVIVDTHYNARQLPTQQSYPYNAGSTPLWTTFLYDGFGRLTSTATPDGTVVSNAYDGLSTITTTSAENTTRTIGKTFNILGWTTNNTDASGAAVSYTYFSDGKPASMTTSGGGVTVSMAYDNAGNRISLTDPDYGTSTAVYDAYGRLMRQNTPKGDYCVYKYDVLGRVIQKQVHGDATTTVYQYNENSHKGTLASITHNGQRLDYTYDNLDRVVTVNETRTDTAYVTRYEYDTISKVSAKTYPSGYKVFYEYFPNGLKKNVKDTHGGILWQTDNINASGQLLQATTGNGAVTSNTYDAATSRLTASSTSNGIQSFAYTFDGFGNLRSRTDSIGTIKTETFTYDNLDRLESIALNNTFSDVVYDSYGRMIRKERDGSTVFESALFDSQKPHATTRVNAPADVFPAGQTIEYTSLDKVGKLSQGTKIATFTYGYDAQRTRMSITDTLTNHTLTKDYVGGCEFVDDNGSRKVYTYLTGPCGVFAVVVGYGGIDTLAYIYKDHLGSWTTITDSLGNVVERNSFDAWGNRRNAATWSGPANGTPLFDRGFTGHEHLYNFGLINMNGRMYDPLLSSFLSPDNYMQDPTTQQGFNRYAYCMYNPLKYIDPSGERYFGYNEAMAYQMLEAMQQQIFHEWFSVYDIAMATHDLLMQMTTTLFSKGNSTGNEGCGTGGGIQVKDLGNGKYEVVGGSVGSDHSITVIDGENAGTIIGYYLTDYSFTLENGNIAIGAIIDLNDKLGQDFWTFFTIDMPGTDLYITSMFIGGLDGYINDCPNTSTFDFKSWGYDNGDYYKLHISRGMSISFGDGNTYITTARDIGNVYAGFLFGYYGWSYETTRNGFDWFNGGPEPPVSKQAQDYGYNLGHYYYNRKKHP